MRGLLLKDLYSMKRFLHTYLLLLVFFMVLAFSMKSASYVVFMGLVVSLSFSFSSIAMDEAGGYAWMLTLPVSRKTIVLEKYVFLFLAVVLTTAVSFLMGTVVGAVMKSPLEELALISLGICGAYILLISVLLPVALQWGTDKARVTLLAVVFLPLLAFIAAARVGLVTEEELEQALGQGGVFLPLLVFAVAVVLVSYVLSVRIFEKKEF